jgi:SRSO17 transposase
MDAKQIAGMGRALGRFLQTFRDCFGRSEPREHLDQYVRGQLSDLQRKSVEPIALAAGTPPRTLQEFLEAAKWDEERMRDGLQQIVAREHAHPDAIGAIDETGHPKKGRHTAAVHRQYCGNTGKIDNCVVSVHVSYVVADFHAILDSDVYLPEAWADDPDRREKAHIPPEVVYRKKADIALDQVRRALANGIRVQAWTFDEWYGRDRAFLRELEGMGQSYVGEIPSNFTVWLKEPRVLTRPRPQDLRKPGGKKRFPRLARQNLRACEVRNLLKHSKVFRRQKWQKFRVKDGEKGPVVWEVKHAPCYIPDKRGLPGPRHTLIVARNVLNPNEVKYFISDRLVNAGDVSLKWMMWVAFARWPIEECFKRAKNELGMDHFEVRSWRSIHRHLYITQLSHLFCSREHQRLRKKNDRDRVSHGRAGARRGLRMVRGSIPPAWGAPHEVPGRRRTNRLPPAPQPAGAEVAREDDTTTPSQTGGQARPTPVVQTPELVSYVAL